MNKNFWEQTGRIFDIQKYSIHDGPGIRTIVFLKGCPLRCQWCCNPESQEFAIQTMHLKDRKPKTVGQDVTVREVMQEVEKDRVYYRRSGGGLTLSGGECLMQPDFATGLLRAVHETGINTAIESTGFAPFETIQKLLPYLDYYLMDIKHTDSRKHQEFTGQPNEWILENAFRIASSSNVELIIRVPVVAPFNGTEEEIASIARFAKSLPGVRKIHLLPYHRLGQDKYEGLGRPYLMSGLEPPSRETMQKLLKAAEEASGLYCQIGG